MSRRAEERYDVIVIGAGYAGLAAAQALEQAGSRVLVLEARDRVGGRAASARTQAGWVDLGATWFWHNEPLIRDYVDQLGVPVFQQHTAGDAIFEPNRETRQRLQGNPIDGPAWRFTNGAEDLAHRLAEQLTPGTIRYREPAHAIEETGDEIIVTSSSGSYAAEQVIVALPPALAVEQLRFEPPLPAPLRQAAAETAVWMGGMVKAVAVYGRPFWRAQCLAGSAVSHVGPFREFHDHSGQGGSPAAIFGFAPSEPLASLNRAELEGAFRQQLGTLFGEPAGEPQEVLVIDWRLEAYTSPAQPNERADTAGFGAPIFQQPGSGRIQFASTETAQAFAGHMEGALRPGRAAAEHITAAPGASGFVW